ncbi:hypothetical protein PAMP_005108 [Pampus punctatissimus]
MSRIPVILDKIAHTFVNILTQERQREREQRGGGFRQLRHPQCSKSPFQEAQSREPLAPEAITRGLNFSTFAGST